MKNGAKQLAVLSGANVIFNKVGDGITAGKFDGLSDEVIAILDKIYDIGYDHGRDRKAGLTNVSV
jgi:hypothetical protein